MKWNVGTKLSVAFGTLAVIFTVVGIVSYRSTTELLEAAAIRTHTNEVLLALEELSGSINQALLDQRSFLLTGQDASLDAYRATTGVIDRSIAALRTLTSDNASQQRRFDRLEPLVENRLAVAATTIQVRQQSGLNAASEAVATNEGVALTTQIEALLEEIRNEETDLLEQRSLVADRNAETAQLTILLGTLAGLLCAIAAGVLITRNIAPPLARLTAVAQGVSEGDLEIALHQDERQDEVGVLSRAFGHMLAFLRVMASSADRIATGDLRTVVNPISDRDMLGTAFSRMTTNLRGQMGELLEGATTLGSASSQIVASTSQLAAGATESATAVSETTTTVEEVRQTAQLANQKAKTVSDSAQRVAEFTNTGRAATEQMAAGMTRIQQQMEVIAGSMMRLGEQGQAIGQIIATVEDLAAQSNLLAVNASIEAAKAGEQGKGFGVVAQEIKAMAEQSRHATNEVRTLLGEIQKATAAAVMATEQGAKAVAAGTQQSEAARNSIQALAGSVSEAAQAATQIAASSQQQLIGMDQVAAAMDSIKQASAQNVASARQLETAARNLEGLGQQLRTMGARYAV